jgi:hypothetical protein
MKMTKKKKNIVVPRSRAEQVLQELDDKDLPYSIQNPEGFWKGNEDAVLAPSSISARTFLMKAIR